MSDRMFESSPLAEGSDRLSARLAIARRPGAVVPLGGLSFLKSVVLLARLVLRFEKRLRNLERDIGGAAGQALCKEDMLVGWMQGQLVCTTNEGIRL